jgi:hypothetical protein
MSPSVTLLGTGGPRRDPTRRSTALLPRTGEKEVLIDAGRGAINGLAEAGADFSRLTRVVLTHRQFPRKASDWRRFPRSPPTRTVAILDPGSLCGDHRARELSPMARRGRGQFNDAALADGEGDLRF